MRQQPKASTPRGPTAEESQKFAVAHQNVLLERMEKQFHAFGEGLILLTEKVDRGFERLESRIDTLENRIDRLEKKLDRLENRMNGLEKRMATFETRLEGVEQVAIEILERVKSLAKRVAVLEADRQVALKGQVAEKELEKQIRQLEKRVVHLESGTGA